jgi:hypothetical protein
MRPTSPACIHTSANPYARALSVFAELRHALLVRHHTPLISLASSITTRAKGTARLVRTEQLAFLAEDPLSCCIVTMYMSGIHSVHLSWDVYRILFCR